MTWRNYSIIFLVNLALLAWNSANAATAAIEPAEHRAESAEADSSAADWTTDGVNLMRMTDPRTLPCGHSFEGESLQKWVTQRTSAGLRPSCPECRHEFASIPPVSVALRAALEWQKAQSAPKSNHRQRKLPKPPKDQRPTRVPADPPRGDAVERRRDLRHYHEPFTREELSRIKEKKYIDNMIRYLNRTRRAYRPFSANLDGRSYIDFQGTWFEIQYEVHYGALLDDISCAWVAPSEVAARLNAIHGKSS